MPPTLAALLGVDPRDASGARRGAFGTRRPAGPTIALLIAHVALAGLLFARPAAARERCEGPPECCPSEHLEHLPAPVAVSLGVAFVGLYNIDDRAQSWEADYYLYESWPPTPGFTPQTEVVNETASHEGHFDETVIEEGRCVRTRRLHSTLHSRFDLRLFPFDRQHLTLRLADAERPSSEVTYAAVPYALSLGVDARGEALAWVVAQRPRFAVAARPFAHHPSAPGYDVATATIDVARRPGFYLTRFFLPLLLILIVAFAVFWIHPEDLGSQAGIGVTCLLATIAFQSGQSSTLPAVEYLTIADRVYATSYSLVALAIIESVYTNALARRGLHDRALRVDRVSRVAFPLGAILLSVVGVLLALRQG